MCEKYFDHIDEQSNNATNLVNAMVASYNIVLYCGRTAIDDNTKINVENFIKNQIKPFFDGPLQKDVTEIFYISSDNSIIVQLFNVTENFLVELEGERLLEHFNVLKDRSFAYLREVEVERALNQ